MWTDLRGAGQGPLDLSVGKEWWVSDGWGLGISGALGYHIVHDSDIDHFWEGASFAVRLSTTLN